MKGYGDNYILNYVEKDSKSSKLIFTITEPDGNSNMITGNTDDLNKILHYDPSIDKNIDFESLQDAIIEHPIPFICKRRKLQDMLDLDFNL